MGMLGTGVGLQETQEYAQSQLLWEMKSVSIIKEAQDSLQLASEGGFTRNEYVSNCSCCSESHGKCIQSTAPLSKTRETYQSTVSPGGLVTAGLMNHPAALPP